VKRTIRTNRWHAVTLKTERNCGEVDIRINSMPDADGHPDRCSAYLTPKKARELAAQLIRFAKHVERGGKP